MPVFKLPRIGFYRPDEGNFGRIYRDDWDRDAKPEMNWYTCREEFHGEGPYKLFFFVTRSPKEVIAFIRRAEDILNLKKRERVKILRTTEKNVLAVRTSLRRFWGDHNRQKLLTILLRAGVNFPAKSRSTKKFWDAALDGEYVPETEYAIRRFMDGFTKFKKGEMDTYSGWVETFEDYTFEDYFNEDCPQHMKEKKERIKEHQKRVNKILLRGCDAHRKRKKVSASGGRRR